jgi:PAS domain S-box-containing protein
MKQNQRTVLIIDDCPEDREVYRRYLNQDQQYSYQILEEEYGEHGLELCKSVQPDAILLDFLLPDIDGLEFLNQLKTQSGKVNLPVVMLTGQGNETIAVAAIKGGASDYLVKGKTNAETLRLAIHNVVERDYLKKQLEASEERFRTSIENMLDSFGIYTSIRDEFGRILDFRIEYVNAAACFSNHMTKEEQIGKNLCELLPMHRQNGLFEDYCYVVETGIPLEKEALIYAEFNNKKNLARVIDIRMTKLGDGFVASWRDVTERKRSSERLRLLESVVVNATDAVIITEASLIDHPGPRIFYVNEAFTQMTGYSPEEILGKSPRFLQGLKTDRGSLDQVRAALIAKQPIQVELINYHKDGSEFWVEMSITPVADDSGEYTHFVAIQRNITERKRTEEKLRESQHFIQQLADTMPGVLYIFDIKEQRNVYGNSQMEKLLGYPVKDIQAMGSEVLQNLMHPEDLERFVLHQEKLQLTQKDEVIEFDYRMRHINGEWRHFRSRDTVVTRDADNSVIQILGIAEDITESKQVKVALQKYADLFEFAHLGLAISDKKGETLELVNPAFAKMHGYTVEEMIGKPIVELFPLECRAELPEYLRIVDETGHYTFEPKHLRKDGTVFPVQIDVTAIKDEQGNMRYRVASVQDITQRQQLLESEQEARKEAEAANRAKDDFIAMVSHDLRSPLSAILGWTQLMRSKKRDEVTIARALETIERNAKAQSQLLEDLLDVSRMIRGTLEIQVYEMQLRPIIEAAISTVQLTAEKKAICLESVFDTTINLISADPNRLQQIIGNLLTNAIKFTPEGGRITVRLERVENYAQITVSDTGKGISADLLPYIFDHFRQGNSTAKRTGLGLGLAIARHLVELHGGTIHVESAGEGMGSTFTVKLPLLLGGDCFHPNSQGTADRFDVIGRGK